MANEKKGSSVKPNFDAGKAAGEPESWILMGSGILCKFEPLNESNIELITDDKDANLYKMIVINVGMDVKHVGLGDEIFAFQGMGYNFEYEGIDYFWCGEEAVKWIIRKAEVNKKDE